MRFMMIMIPDAYRRPVPPDFVPPAEAVEKMRRFTEELQKAGVLLALDGLHPPEKAVRVSFDATGKPTVTDGPFAEAKEAVGVRAGGFWPGRGAARTRADREDWQEQVSGLAIDGRHVLIGPCHPRNRGRVPGARSHHCPAHRTRQTYAIGSGRALRSATWRGAREPAAFGAGSNLFDLQRRLCGNRQRGLDTPASLPGSDAPGPYPFASRVRGI
jgi:hypothetical protein